MHKILMFHIFRCKLIRFAVPLYIGNLLSGHYCVDVVCKVCGGITRIAALCKNRYLLLLLHDLSYQLLGDTHAIFDIIRIRTSSR